LTFFAILINFPKIQEYKTKNVGKSFSSNINSIYYSISNINTNKLNPFLELLSIRYYINVYIANELYRNIKEYINIINTINHVRFQILITIVYPLNLRTS